MIYHQAMHGQPLLRTPEEIAAFKKDAEKTPSLSVEEIARLEKIMDRIGRNVELSLDFDVVTHERPS